MAYHLLAGTLLATLSACGGGGGGGAGAPGGTPPTTPPPVEALKVYEVVWPANVWTGAPGKDAAVTLKATGGDGRNTWSVDCPASLACSIADDKLYLESRAQGTGVSMAAVSLTVTDGQGARASTTRTVTAWPKAMSQGLQTLVGAVDRPGLHLVILGDGFSEAQAGALHEMAATFTEQFFRHPEIAAHRGAWNIHRVAVPPDPDPARSRFNSEIGCYGIQRLLCVNSAQAQRIAALYVPSYTQVLVVMNSQVYAGGGGPVATMTLNPGMLPSAVHELGHSFASLGDEYVDEGSADKYVFREGWYRNATAYTDRELIPWKHWIEPGMQLPTLTTTFAAGTDPVGLFEGSNYVAKGIYRPTYASFMRFDGNSPVGAVNGEIWAQAVYGRGGAWAETAPAETAPGTPALDRNAQPAGGWVFKAQPVMDRAVCETRWYVNGVERTDQRGAAKLVVANAEALQVRVELVDLTGRVRQNAGVVSKLNWSVQ